MAGDFNTACRGKDKHRDKTAADHQALKRGSHTSLASNKKLNSYHCEYCQRWHVGNSNTAKRQPYNRAKLKRKW